MNNIFNLTCHLAISWRDLIRTTCCHCDTIEAKVIISPIACQVWARDFDIRILINIIAIWEHVKLPKSNIELLRHRTRRLYKLRS